MTLNDFQGCLAEDLIENASTRYYDFHKMLWTDTKHKSWTTFSMCFWRFLTPLSRQYDLIREDKATSCITACSSFIPALVLATGIKYLCKMGIIHLTQVSGVKTDFNSHVIVRKLFLIESGCIKLTILYNRFTYKKITLIKVKHDKVSSCLQESSVLAFK